MFHCYYTIERTVLSWVFQTEAIANKKKTRVQSHGFTTSSIRRNFFDAIEWSHRGQCTYDSGCSTTRIFREVASVEHIPSSLGTNQRVIPDPHDCNESSLFSAHQSITIVPGSFNISTRATHFLSSREVGCKDLEFPSSVSDTPPPPYETAMILLRPRPVKITWRDVTPCPDHVFVHAAFHTTRGSVHQSSPHVWHPSSACKPDQSIHSMQIFW